MSAQKFDQDKLRVDLVPPEAIAELAKVLAFGAAKYGDYNWLQGMKWSRVYAAAVRHLLAWYGGEVEDPESKLSHLSHALCNIVFLITYANRGGGTDDRRGPGA